MLTRRTPLRSRSLKLQRAMTIYRREVRLFLEENTTCQHPTNHVDQPVPSVVVHHKRGRFGKRLLDKRFWAASCVACNAEPEDDTGKSLECGWLIRIEGVAP